MPNMEKANRGERFILTLHSNLYFTEYSTFYYYYVYHHIERIKSLMKIGKKSERIKKYLLDSIL